MAEEGTVVFDVTVGVLKGLRSEINRVRKQIGETTDLDDLLKLYKIVATLTERYANILEHMKGA